MQSTQLSDTSFIPGIQVHKRGKKKPKVFWKEYKIKSAMITLQELLRDSVVDLNCGRLGERELLMNELEKIRQFSQFIQNSFQS